MLAIIVNLWRKELLLLRRVPRSFAWSLVATWLGGVSLSVFAYSVIFAPAPRPAQRELPAEGLSRAGTRLPERLKQAGFVLSEHRGEIRAAVAAGQLAAGLLIPEGFGSPAEQGGSTELRLFVNRGVGGPLTRPRELERLRLALAGYDEDRLAEQVGQGHDQRVTTAVAVDFRELGSETQRLGTLMALVCTLLMGALMGGGTSGARTVTRVTNNEQEHKTLEALLVTPSSKAQILAGKLAAVFTMNLAGTPLVLLGYWSGATFMGGVFGLEVSALHASLGNLARALPVVVALTLVVNVLFVAIAFCLGKRKQLAMILGVVGLLLYGLMIWSFNAPPDSPLAYLVPFYGLIVLAQSMAAGATPAAHAFAYALGSGVLTSALAFFLALNLFNGEREAYTA